VLVLSLVDLFIIKADAWIPVHGFVAGTSGRKMTRNGQRSTTNTTPGDDATTAKYAVPKLVVFDLDGCLWRPEMYELVHFSGGKGAPFRPSEHDKNVLLTVAGEPVHLLKDVREVMRELYLDPQWQSVMVGISSRTDAPHWARELLQKFTVSHEGGSFVLDDVFQNGPIEMKGDSKIQHFRRIAQATNISLEEMVFFDNEYGNCESVAGLGVTVGYCPGGVCKLIWKATMEAFPAKRGKVVRL
jgi:magnesium-dependent phosphatase 1